MSRFLEIKLNDWLDLSRLAPSLTFCVYRGQSNAKWDLSTSFERLMQKHSGYPCPAMLENREHWILHEFKRRYQLYGSNPPPKDDNFEWLALLQHHGCPTRLLDFTCSIYIAAYFAVMNCDDDAAIWSINRINLRGRAWEFFKLDYERPGSLQDEVNRHHIDLANRFIENQSLNEEKSFIIEAESLIPNRRLALQQGIFMSPTNLQKSYMHNLLSAFGRLDSGSQHLERVDCSEINTKFGEEHKNFDIEILKIVIPNHMIRAAISDLAMMNITEETLFPGLDGFARSLVQTVVRR